MKLQLEEQLKGSNGRDPTITPLIRGKGPGSQRVLTGPCTTTKRINKPGRDIFYNQQIGELPGHFL